MNFECFSLFYINVKPFDFFGKQHRFFISSFVVSLTSTVSSLRSFSLKFLAF